MRRSFSPNFNYKERRLIYETVPKRTNFKDINEAVDAIVNSPDDVAREGVKRALGKSNRDVATAQQIVDKINEKRRTRTELTALKTKLAVHGIDITVDAATGKTVEQVTFREAAPATPDANKLGGSALKRDAKGNVTGLSDTAKKDIESAGSKLGHMLKPIIEVVMALFKSITEIANDLKALIADIVENFKYDSSKLATTDKLVDKQINDPEVKPEFLDIHKENTITEIRAIDEASDPTSIEGKKNEIATLKAQRDADVAAIPKILDKNKKELEYSASIKKAEAALKEMESKQRSGKTRRPKLIARLAVINSRLKLRSDDGLDGPSGNPPPPPLPETSNKSDQENANTAEAQKAVKLEKAKKDAWDAYDNLQVVLSSSNLEESEVLKSLEITRPIDSFNTAIQELEDDAVKTILKEIGIYTATSTDEGVYETVELDANGQKRFKLVYEKPYLRIELNDTGDNE